MISTQFQLDGKTALVAGDSKYWAKYAAAALAEAGAEIAVAANNSAKVDAAVAEAKKFGKEALAVTADMTDEAQAEAAVKQVAGKFGKIDILVNCADIKFAKPFAEMTSAEWRKMLDLNLNSVFNTCHAAGKLMLERESGRIINITSCLAERGMVNSTAYCASMGGVLQLTRSLALEWATKGITVNAIGAGWMAEEERTGALDEERLIKYIPHRRYGRPSDIGSLLCFMASDASSFFTSEFIPVDGAVMNKLF